MELVVRAKAQGGHFLPNGEKLPDGKKCVSILPEYVEDPANPGQRWPEVNLKSGHGITFVSDEKTLREDEILTGIEPGKSYRIVITEAGSQ
jgi:hypothetical protein